MSVTAKRHAEAMDKVGSLVSVRERCCSEVAERLKGAGFTEEEVQDALDTAVRLGIVSDERYARSFIQGKTALGWGREKIISRLKGNGLSEETIMASGRNMLDEGCELRRAVHELSRRSVRSDNPQVAMMRRLSNKGYSFETAKRAVEEFMSSVE